MKLLECQRKLHHGDYYQLVIDVLWKLLDIHELDLSTDEQAIIREVIKEFKK